MFLCIPSLFMFSIKQLHSWKSQKRCIQLHAWSGYRVFPHKMSRLFKNVILPVLCWFLVAFFKLVAWLWDTRYELQCSLHFSEMLASTSSCRKVDSSIEYLISTGFGLSVYILVSRKWKLLLLVRWRTDHQGHSGMAMEWNYMPRWSQFSLFVFSLSNCRFQ